MYYIHIHLIQISQDATLAYQKNKAIADQIQIVNYAIQNLIHMAADKYGVETKSIRNWKKQLPELLKMTDKSIKSPLHHGGKAETDEVENEIVDWILINRS